ncbi:hypothetical protein RBB78_24215 [Tunturiibacter empetritectus]|uniref:hypothetical protein n=1 Tax=Tunturiibacter empetritectus TaxID=3069691 RepID=UPI003D9B6CA6
MNRMQSLAFRLAGVAFGAAMVCSSWVALRAQAPAAPAAKAAAEEEDNPFTPKPAVPLPPGMTGSTMNDPRVGLKPGLYDAGETAMGMEHLAFVKKPNAFQLSSTNPDDPAVQKSLDLIGVGNRDKIPKPMQLVIAQLAFANSDFAFQGTHLFQGNFYGVSFYDISNPAKVSLITTLVCPGGQGDVSVYGNLLFMSVEMPNGRLDCGVQGFPPLPRRSRGMRRTTGFRRRALIVFAV